MKKKSANLISPNSETIQLIERRLFLKRAVSLGTLSLLSGCEFTNSDAMQRILRGMSRFNDEAQAALFNPSRLAPEYSEDMIVKPFPFNAFYNQLEAPVVDGASYQLELLGLIREKKSWALKDLAALPQTSQVTRLICVEGWSAIGKWGGVRFSDFLHRIGADTTAKFVGFKCADDYHTSIDMASALHPQTLLALTFADETLPVEYGFPLRLRIPTKLGFKNPKHITAIYVTNTYPGGYWEDQGYNWFSGC
ncbi:MAG TPA: molybdopterin-dependent oxidoreductase [Burkholderiales bacterium]|nr:molybdopterin-dependent oxidoreductase [Burkholderiales bacterium]